jgi:hypothetical protein
MKIIAPAPVATEDEKRKETPFESTLNWLGNNGLILVSVGSMGFATWALG